MATVQYLTQELSNLALELRRRNPEIRHACDLLLALLKQYALFDPQAPQALQRENRFLQQVVAALNEFVVPFAMACQLRNTKYLVIAVQCLNRMVTLRCLPRERMDVVLDTLAEASHLAIEIQLKVLQLLPPLFQNYADTIHGPLAAQLLHMCALLQSTNKVPVVVNTALATLQQLTITVFDKVRNEDKTERAGDPLPTVPVEGDATVAVAPGAHDAYRVLLDLVHLLDKLLPPEFLRSAHLSLPLFGFELLENVLISHTDLFLTHPELAFLLRVKVAPLLLRVLSSGTQFAIVVRVLRILFLLIRTQLQVMPAECEVALLMLAYLLSSDLSAPEWKQALALEVFHGIMANPELVREVFTEYELGTGADDSTVHKRVLSDLLEAAAAYLEAHRGLLCVLLVLPPPTSAAPANRAEGDALQPAGLSAYSRVKVAYLDLLDKNEPPAMPPTYPLYLILLLVNQLADGLTRLVAELEEGSPGPALLVAALVTGTSPQAVRIYSTLLHAAIDNDMFSVLVRHLQKLGHAAGVVGVDSAKDAVVDLLAAAAVNNEPSASDLLMWEQERLVHPPGATPPPAPGPTEGLSISSIVESISTSILQRVVLRRQLVLDARPGYRTRRLHGRHIICYKALFNLAIALGPKLGSSWRTVLVALQWVDYCVNGPDREVLAMLVETPSALLAAPSLDTLPPAPHLLQRDLQLLASHRQRLLGSTGLLPTALFSQVVGILVELSSLVVGAESSAAPAPVVESRFAACPYNQLAFLEYLTEVSASRLRLMDDAQAWDTLVDYFIRVGTDRRLSGQARQRAMQAFTQALDKATTEGFADDSVTSSLDVETKSLTPLMGFVEQLLRLDIPEDILTMHVETELVMQALHSLKELLDHHGPRYGNLWDIIFKMLDLPFRIERAWSDNGGDREDEPQNADKTVVPLLQALFDTLQLVLDEFLPVLPTRQFRLLVDCLARFARQELVLNISFNAILYFWTVSDALRAAVVQQHPDGCPAAVALAMDRAIRSDRELEAAASVDNQDDDQLRYALWVYLLRVLTRLAKDMRVQVRNGAIQTFFRVVESHGEHLPLWPLVYRVVVAPMMETDVAAWPKGARHEMAESLGLVLKNCVQLFRTYLGLVGEALVAALWVQLVSLLQALSGLRIDVDIGVFKAFKELLVAMGEHQPLPEPLCTALFALWLEFPITYDIAHNDAYQELLLELMGCFVPLQLVLGDAGLQPAMLDKLLVLIASCARYPLLPEMARDTVYCTPLQQAVVDNAEWLCSRPDTPLVVVEQLALWTTLPFLTRLRIVAKFGDRLPKQYRVPLFVGLSTQAVGMLRQQLEQPDRVGLLVASGLMLKVVRLLLEPVQMRDAGDVLAGGLWTQCLQLLVELVPRVAEHKVLAEFWTLVVEIILECVGDHGEGDDAAAVQLRASAYGRLRDTVVANLKSLVLSETASSLVLLVWKTSFVYTLDEVETAVERENPTPQACTAALVQLDPQATFGSTAPPVPLPHQSLRQECLRDLATLANSGLVAPEMASHALDCLVNRAAFLLRRVLEALPLLDRCPLDQAYVEELVQVLAGVLAVVQSDPAPDAARRLQLVRPLVVRLVPWAHRVDGAASLLERVLVATA